MEFQHQCGLQSVMPRQYLYVCCPFPDRMPCCSSIGPMIYLSAEQVIVISAAIWDKLGCALTPAPEGTLDDIYAAHQEIYISDTLPYSEWDTDWLLQGGAPKVAPDAGTSESSGPDLEGFEHLYHINYSDRGNMSEIHVLSTGTRTRLATQAYNGFIVHIPVTKTVRDVLFLLKRRLRLNVMRLTLETHSRVLLPTDALSSTMSMTMRIARPLRSRVVQPVMRRPVASRATRRRRMPENFNFRNEHMLAFVDSSDRTPADVLLLSQCQAACDGISVIFAPELTHITEGSSFFVVIHDLDGQLDRRRVVSPPNFTIQQVRILVLQCLRQQLGPAFFFSGSSKIFLDEELVACPVRLFHFVVVDSDWQDSTALAVPRQSPSPQSQAPNSDARGSAEEAPVVDPRSDSHTITLVRRLCSRSHAASPTAQTFRLEVTYQTQLLQVRKIIAKNLKVNLLRIRVLHYPSSEDGYLEDDYHPVNNETFSLVVLNSQGMPPQPPPQQLAPPRDLQGDRSRSPSAVPPSRAPSDGSDTLLQAAPGPSRRTPLSRPQFPPECTVLRQQPRPRSRRFSQLPVAEQIREELDERLGQVRSILDELPRLLSRALLSDAAPGPPPRSGGAQNGSQCVRQGANIDQATTAVEFVGLVSGGGAGLKCGGKGAKTLRNRSNTRSRSPPRVSSSAQLSPVEDNGPGDAHSHLYVPSWRFPGAQDGTQTQCVHISTEAADPVSATFPQKWPRAYFERKLAQHTGHKTGWLDFEWIDQDVAMGPSATCPRLDLQGLTALLKGINTCSLHAHSSLAVKELVIGRSYASKVLTPFSIANQELVRPLVAAVACQIPDVHFNSITIVEMQDRAAGHVNPEPQDVVLLPASQCVGARVWLQCDTGMDSVTIASKSVSGVWLPFDRPVCVCPGCTYQVCSSPGSRFMVVPKVKGSSNSKVVADLAHLEFPLEPHELDLLEDQDLDCQDHVPSQAMENSNEHVPQGHAH
eukprot:6471367-Amphidinium_carterae.2